MWKSKGFSLIELMIAIGLMAVISAGAFATIGQGPKQSARDARRQSDLASIVSALEIYRSDNPGYPACPSGTSCAPFAIANYLTNVPTDPSSGRTYGYVPSNCSGGFCRGYTLCASLEKNYAALPVIAACNATCTTNCNFSMAGP